MPGALQEADRWYLLEDAATAFLPAVRTAAPVICKALGIGEIAPVVRRAVESLQTEGFLRRHQSNASARRMVGEIVPLKRIVPLTGLSRKLVHHILRAQREDVFLIRQSSLDPRPTRHERDWAA